MFNLQLIPSENIVMNNSKVPEGQQQQENKLTNAFKYKNEIGVCNRKGNKYA